MGCGASVFPGARRDAVEACQSGTAGQSSPRTADEGGQAPPSLEALGRRLVRLGEVFSLEIAPSDVAAGLAGAGVPEKGPKKLLALQAEALAAGRPVLREGMPIFVNMVKPSMEHFEDVAAASGALSAAGFSPVPHLPAARFATAAECRGTLQSLAAAGAKHVLALGGNDLQERLAAKACAYDTGAEGLLAAETAALRAAGFHSVGLAGHPDGHPGLGWDTAATAAALLAKARPLLEVGLNVVVATQFCFDARKLIKWLQRTRSAFKKLLDDIASSVEAPGRVSFCIGLPGPTPRKKLERIAQICEVPSIFISSAFEFADQDHDGCVSWEEFQVAVEAMNFSKRSQSKLLSLYTRHSGEEGGMGPEAFANFLVDDAVKMSSKTSFVQPEKAPPPGAAVSGPSAFVQDAAASKAEVSAEGAAKQGASAIVWPDELVLALAAYCEREGLADGEVMLHFFPFGGLARTFELISQLQAGSWPRPSPVSAQS